MTARSKCWGIVILAFAIGLIGGVLIGIYRPNEITFLIRANGEVNLYPLHRGDVIRWVAEDPGSTKLPDPAGVNFYKKSGQGIPCTETPDPNGTTDPTYPVSKCTITTVPLDYYYDCMNPHNHHPCRDPGSGPGCTTCPHSQVLELAFRDAIYDYKAKSLHPLIGGVGAKNPPPDGSILCAADGTPRVTPISYSASSGDAMEWSSSVTSYSFDLSQASPSPLPSSPLTFGCTEGVTAFSSDMPNAICTPTNYGATRTVWSYNVNVQGCSQGSTATGTITIVP